jgi:hypothetical protein
MSTKLLPQCVGMELSRTRKHCSRLSHTPRRWSSSILNLVIAWRGRSRSACRPFSLPAFRQTFPCEQGRISRRVGGTRPVAGDRGRGGGDRFGRGLVVSGRRARGSCTPAAVSALHTREGSGGATPPGPERVAASQAAKIEPKEKH